MNKRKRYKLKNFGKRKAFAGGLALLVLIAAIAFTGYKSFFAPKDIPFSQSGRLVSSNAGKSLTASKSSNGTVVITYTDGGSPYRVDRNVYVTKKGIKQHGNTLKLEIIVQLTDVVSVQNTPDQYQLSTLSPIPPGVTQVEATITTLGGPPFRTISKEVLRTPIPEI